MGSSGVSSVAMAVVVVMAMVVMAPGVAAQAAAPQCAQRLIPCGQYIGTTTTPPESCCGQIREAVQNELPCLCSLLSNKQLLEAVKINVTQALELPKRCGINSDTSLCNSSTNTTTAAGGPSAPPATPGKDNGAPSLVRIGASGVVVLLAFWWSLVA